MGYVSHYEDVDSLSSHRTQGLGSGTAGTAVPSASLSHQSDEAASVQAYLISLDFQAIMKCPKVSIKTIMKYQIA